MAGHFGFSYIGLVFLLLFVPNIIWTSRKPQGYTSKNENKVLLIFERAGEFFWGVPLAGATLPVISFFLLGIYGKVVWLLISTIILGIGHIGIHMQHSKEISIIVQNAKKKC